MGKEIFQKEDLNIENKLGRGGFGEVYLGKIKN